MSSEPKTSVGADLGATDQWVSFITPRVLELEAVQDWMGQLNEHQRRSFRNWLTNWVREVGKASEAFDDIESLQPSSGWFVSETTPSDDVKAVITDAIRSLKAEYLSKAQGFGNNNNNKDGTPEPEKTPIQRLSDYIYGIFNPQGQVEYNEDQGQRQSLQQQLRPFLPDSGNRFLEEQETPETDALKMQNLLMGQYKPVNWPLGNIDNRLWVGNLVNQGLRYQDPLFQMPVMLNGGTLDPANLYGSYRKMPDNINEYYRYRGSGTPTVSCAY